MSDARGAGGRPLRRLVLTIADSKRILGIRYGEWILGAPAIEAGIAASSMAQDEWGHARLVYAMLKELGEDPMEVEHGRDPAEYCNVEALDEPLPDWPAFVAANVVVDGALTAALEGFGAGGHEQAASRVPKMLAEEEFHADHGRAWLRRLAAASGDGPERLRDACLRVLPACLRWVGSDRGVARLLAEEGVGSSPEEVEERYLRRLTEALAPLGLDPREAPPPREPWEEARARGPGAPDAEAVRRATGARNRALFVE